MNHKTCGEILNEQLEILRRRDPKLSLRQFAKMVDVPVSTLSQVMNGIRGLGVKRAWQIAQALGFDSELRSQFLSSLLNTPLARMEGPIAATRPATCRPHGTWIHHAIRELSAQPHASLDPVWIASTLNISLGEARDALKDLRDADLLRSEGPSDEPRKVIIHTHSKQSKIFHTTLMHRAEESLSYRKREMDLSAIMLPIDKTKIRQVKKRVREFQVRLMNDFGGGENGEIYALQINLFPLSEEMKTPAEEAMQQAS